MSTAALLVWTATALVGLVLLIIWLMEYVARPETVGSYARSATTRLTSSESSGDSSRPR